MQIKEAARSLLCPFILGLLGVPLDGELRTSKAPERFGRESFKPRPSSELLTGGVISHVLLLLLVVRITPPELSGK